MYEITFMRWKKPDSSELVPQTIYRDDLSDFDYLMAYFGAVIDEKHFVKIIFKETT